MPCWELFEAQDPDYPACVLGDAMRVAVETAVRLGYNRWIGLSGAFVGMGGFGASASAETLFQHFGILRKAAVNAVENSQSSGQQEAEAP
jgi:transketolase